MRRELLAILCVLFLLMNASAQNGEIKTPAYRNRVIENNAQLLPEPLSFHMVSFSKTSDSLRFPFIDRFYNTDNNLSSQLWADTNVTKAKGCAVFNALNAQGVPYSGSQADLLNSKNIDTRNVNSAYVELVYSTGASWSNTDSLILQFLTPSGNWQTIWRSLSVPTSVRPAFVSINNFTNYQSASFRLRMICYTTPSLTNTETFVLHSFVLSSSNALPWYENFQRLTTSYFPSNLFWSQATTEVNSVQYSPSMIMNSATFDAQDVNGNTYDTVQSKFGFADTLQSHPFNLNAYAVSDSVYLRFYYTSTIFTKPNEKLYVQYRNNTGIWIVVDSLARNDSLKPLRYIASINIGKFRSSTFQFRLINTTNFSPADSMKWFVYGIAIDKKISLPFIDDFSSSSVYPDPNKWMDKQVFINNDFPIRPPSYNVATFDGLNSRGVPYGVGTGYCDSLTSLPINLFGYTPSDSLMLSFFVQPKGLGNLPRNGDSLLLEFRTNSYDNNSYTPVWYQSQVAYPKNVFTQVFVKVDSSFLHDDFQFRFRKKGDLSGNLHHWHIDYVRLDKGRISRDTAFSDISISSSPQGLIKNYTSVPWKHFIADSANLMNDSQYFYIKNNNNIAYAINFSREVFNEQPQRIDTFGNVLPTFSPVSDTTVAVGRKIAMQPFVTGDTVLFNSVFTVRSGVSFDNIPSNDVISVKTRFSNYLAYDDGTAEAGYGLEKAGGSVALGFSMPYADSLFGVAVFFNRSLNDVSNKPFNLQIYRAIGTSGGGQGEDIIKSIPFNGAVYTNNLNGFYYYKLEQPILVPSYFYVGWKQTELFSINVGCDENYRYNFAYGPNPNLYYKTSDLPIWQASSLTGTIMIRPIVGKWIDPPVGVTEVPTSKKNFFVSFPNPANDILQVQSNVGELPNELELIDVSGRTMMRAKNETTLHVNMLPEGIYFLKIIDKNNQASVIKISILHP